MVAKPSKPRSPKTQNGPGEDPGAVRPLVSPEQVARFAALFDGYTKAHGVYRLDKSRTLDSGKVEGKAFTENGPPGLDKYRRHLDGTGHGLGIILLRDDDSVVFGAIDYDNPRKTDHAKAAKRVAELQLPLLVCRSKSGGGHFYCFTAEPVPAAVMRERLDEWKALLGMSDKTEVFPKQSYRHSEADFGSWINLPYFDVPGPTTRHAYTAEGTPLDFPAFLDTAEALRVSRAQLETAAPGNAESDLFHEGPPCLQVIHLGGGFAEGGRNLGMTAVMTYLKKRFPDSWQSKVDEYNAEMGRIGSQELQQIVKNYQRKDYGYQCKQPPIHAHCQRKECLRRTYGVGESTPDAKGYDLVGLTRYDSAHGDEPLWGLEVNGKRVMVSNTALYSRDDFNRACMAQANVLPVHTTPGRWLKFLSELLPSASVVPMPDDAGPRGQLWNRIQGFLLQNTTALERDEVLLGKPYRHEGKVYFRSTDLFQYLDARRVAYKSPQDVWALLRDQQAEKDTMHVGTGAGKTTVNVWILPIPELAVSDVPPAVQFVPGTEAF